MEKCLDRCVESIVNQSLRDIEIILVDDGSPDKVPQICDEWAKKDCRIKVVHKKNEGLGFARNSGLEMAIGDYIAFVDSDDFVDYSMYEALYNEANSSQADVVYCGINNEKGNGIWEKKSDLPVRTVYEGVAQVRTLMLDFIASKPHEKKERPFRMSVWHSIYRHSIITEHSIIFKSEREVASEDLPFQCEFLSKSSKVIYIPDCYYYYCLNGTSLTSTFRKEKFPAYINLRNTIIQLFPNDEDVINRIDRHIIGNCRRYLRLMFSANVPHKLSIVEDMLDNPIWETLRKEYKPSYLQPFQSVIYMLQLLHCRFLLIGLIWISIKLQNK